MAVGGQPCQHRGPQGKDNDGAQIPAGASQGAGILNRPLTADPPNHRTPNKDVQIGVSQKNLEMLPVTQINAG